MRTVPRVLQTHNACPARLLCRDKFQGKGEIYLSNLRVVFVSRSPISSCLAAHYWRDPTRPLRSTLMCTEPPALPNR